MPLGTDRWTSLHHQSFRRNGSHNRRWAQDTSWSEEQEPGVKLLVLSNCRHTSAALGCRIEAAPLHHPWWPDGCVAHGRGSTRALQRHKSTCGTQRWCFLRHYLLHGAPHDWSQTGARWRAAKHYLEEIWNAPPLSKWRHSDAWSRDATQSWWCEPGKKYLSSSVGGDHPITMVDYFLKKKKKVNCKNSPCPASVGFADWPGFPWHLGSSPSNPPPNAWCSSCHVEARHEPSVSAKSCRRKGASINWWLWWPKFPQSPGASQTWDKSHSKAPCKSKK